MQGTVRDGGSRTAGSPKGTMDDVRAEKARRSKPSDSSLVPLRPQGQACPRESGGCSSLVASLAVAIILLSNRADAAYAEVGGSVATVGVGSYGAFGSPYGSVWKSQAVTPFTDGLLANYDDWFLTDNRNRWWMFDNPGEYIDRGRYYWLDEAQYYYFDEGQYNLLAEAAYLLGRPRYSMRYAYHFYWWGAILARLTPPPQKASQEWVDLYGEFTIFHEPAQIGDILRAYVTGENEDPICVEQFIVTVEGRYGDLRILRDDPLTPGRDGAQPGETITFGAWDKSAQRWYTTEIVHGSARWTYHGARIRVDVNAIPEPCTITFLGLGALAVLLRRGEKRHPRRS